MKSYLWSELMTLARDLCLIDEVIEAGKINQDMEYNEAHKILMNIYDTKYEVGEYNELSENL